MNRATTIVIGLSFSISVLSQFADAEERVEKMPWELPSSEQAELVIKAGGYTSNACQTVNRSEELKQEDIRNCMSKSNGALAWIYQKYLKDHPDTQGTLVFLMEIDPSGVLKKPEVVSNDGLPTELVDELLSRVAAISFPASPSGWRDKYTLNFYPK